MYFVADVEISNKRGTRVGYEILKGVLYGGCDKPKALPLRPQFSSGPCIKRPGWSIDQIQKYLLIGRSHRAKEPNHQLFRIIQLVKELLQIPEDYLVGIVPASNTGAYEMLMWNLLGAKR